MNCPSCGKSQAAVGAECPFCGLVFSKWKAAPRVAPPSSPAPSVTFPQAVAVIAAGAVFTAAAIWVRRPDSAIRSPLALVMKGACGPVLRYHVGATDARTGFDQAAVARAAAAAAARWEEAIGGKLFEYDEAGNWSIQTVNDRWLTLAGIEQSSERLELDRPRYDSLTKEYRQLESAFKQRSEAFRRNVEAWNSRGGAREAYERLERERREIDEQYARLSSLYTQIRGLNWADSVESQRVQELAKEYDRVGECDRGGRVIRLFYAADEDDLIRLLTHEMGHALGLGHVADPEAVMGPRKNKQRELASEDKKALFALCGKTPRK